MGKVRRAQLGDRSEAAHAIAEPPKTPGRDATPPQVFDRTARVAEFPIEHGANAFVVDEEIAGAKIAVHEHWLARCGQMIFQIPKGDLERR